MTFMPLSQPEGMEHALVLQLTPRTAMTTGHTDLDIQYEKNLPEDKNIPWARIGTDMGARDTTYPKKGRFSKKCSTPT
jgi:hypothetical protein